MKKILVIGLILFPAACFAGGQKCFINGGKGSVNLSTSANQYYTPVIDVAGTSAAEVNEQAVFPIAGTLDNFIVASTASMGAGVVVLDVQVNGSTSALKVNFSGILASDLVHTVSVNAGDKFSIQSFPSIGTSTGTGTYSWSIRFTAAAHNQSILIYSSPNTYAASTTVYIGVMGDTTPSNVTEATHRLPLPTGGTFKNLYYLVDAAPVGAATSKITLFKNGVATAITCTITGAATSCQDTVDSVSGSQFDGFDYQIVTAGAVVARPRAGIEFDPTNDGESIGGTQELKALSGSQTRWDRMTGTTGVVSPTEGSKQIVMDACTVKTLVSTSTLVGGAAQSYTINVRNNGASFSPDITASIPSGSYNASDLVNSGTINQGDLVNFQMVTTGATGALTVGAGIVFYVTPDATGGTTPLRTLMGIGQ